MNKYLAELVGTFALVFCGTGAIVINEVSGGAVGHQGIAITFGLIVMAMVYSIGELSGAHINPAVTIAFTIAKKFPVQHLLPYIIAQVLGALLASGLLRFLFPEAKGLGETLPAGSIQQSFVLEVVLSFFLMFVIFQVISTSKEISHWAGAAIGATVLLEAMFAGPICGASMNPARSIGPAVINGNLVHLWAYIVAPILGMIISFGVWKLLQEKQ
ncbi:MAG: aquaporin [Saprospiraceae bacterium]|nr:aquaporin [Saprospiraceae bacterium]